jgi:hypothetical protein
MFLTQPVIDNKVKQQKTPLDKPDGVKKISFKIILSRSLREDRYQPTHDRSFRKP